MYYRACDCPKGHTSYPESKPECCALSAAAAGLGGHFQPARDPGAFYQRSPASGFGAIEASNIGPVITRREMRGRPNRTRAMWTNNAEVMGNAIHGFGEDVVSTRVAMPTTDAMDASGAIRAPVPYPAGEQPILLSATAPREVAQIAAEVPTPSPPTAPPPVAFPACPAGQMWNPTAGLCEVRMVAPGSGTPGEQCFVGGGKWDAQKSVCTRPPLVTEVPQCEAGYMELPASLAAVLGEYGYGCMPKVYVVGAAVAGAVLLALGGWGIYAVVKK